jgi:hypothetical protein
MSDSMQPFRIEFPRGKHFPAMEAPAQLAADLQAFFGPLQ